MPSFKQPSPTFTIVTITGEMKYTFKMELRARSALMGVLSHFPEVKRSPMSDSWCIREEPCGYGPPFYIPHAYFEVFYNLAEALCMTRSGAAPARVELAG